VTYIYQKTDMCKFESSQKDESWVEEADSSQAGHEATACFIVETYWQLWQNSVDRKSVFPMNATVGASGVRFLCLNLPYLFDCVCCHTFCLCSRSCVSVCLAKLQVDIDSEALHVLKTATSLACFCGQGIFTSVSQTNKNSFHCLKTSFFAKTVIA